MTRSAGNEALHVPYPIVVDVRHLFPGDRLALQHILTAMGQVDTIFRRMTRQESTEGPFVYDSHRGREFYPAGFTQGELDVYLRAHPERRQELLNETVAIQWNGKDFVAVPYSELYRKEGAAIALELRGASRVADDEDLSRFLLRSADAFLGNDHDRADEAWVRVGERFEDSTMELTIGFHERDLDDWWGVKRSVQAVLGLINQKETAKLRVVQARLRKFDAVLGRKYGYTPSPSPITLVAIDQIECAGWAAHHLVPTAYLLPNSADFRDAHGGKQVFSWSMLRGRLELITKPIGLRVLAPVYHRVLDEEVFKLFVAAHECGHSTGFQFSGVKFKAYALPLEEGRADVVGLYALLAEAGPGREVSTQEAFSCVILHLVDGFRQIRSNPRGMHAVGTTVQYNWLLHTGALRLENGSMCFETGFFLGAYATLCDEFYRVYSSLREEEAHAFVGRWGVASEEVIAMSQGFTDLPRDLDPRFEIVGLA